MNYNLEEFGAELKRIRINSFLTQKNVENMIGVNVDTLRRLENGKSLPKIDTLDKLSIIYSVDLYIIFNKYRHTIDNYISKRMKEISKLFHNYSYDQIKSEAEMLKSNFSSSSFHNDVLVTKKLKQFTEYLISLQNLNQSIADISRFDLTNLFNALGYSLNDFHDSNLSFKFDKLEIRILILASIIYRAKGEFENSFKMIEEAHTQLMRNYTEDPEFLYLYITITYNRMTYFHRIDSFDKIDNLHTETLDLFDSEIGIQNIASYLIRIGINKHNRNDDCSDEYINIAINLLKDSGNPVKAESFRKSLQRQYPSIRIN
jgi:transcriptional regulator with XRE-family HTH domain